MLSQSDTRTASNLYPVARETKKAIEAIAITPVASQPKTTRARWIRNGPIIFVLVAIFIVRNMTGTATTAFSAAAQIKALIRLIFNTFAAAPRTVAIAMAL